MKNFKLTADEVSLLSSLMDLSSTFYNEGVLGVPDNMLNLIESLLPLNATTILQLGKDKIKAQVDAAAEVERLKYITNGVGQSMTYQEKVNQAAIYTTALYAYKADPKTNKAPNEAEYPLLQASIGIDGKTLADVAEMVTYAYAMWQQVGASIEATRLQSKFAIDEAKTVEAAQAIYDGIKWQSL